MERHLREEKCILQSPLYFKYRLEQFCNAHRFFTDFINCVVLSYPHTTVARIGQIFSFTLATRQQEWWWCLNTLMMVPTIWWNTRWTLHVSLEWYCRCPPPPSPDLFPFALEFVRKSTLPSQEKKVCNKSSENGYDSLYYSSCLYNNNPELKLWGCLSANTASPLASWNFSAQQCFIDHVLHYR